jgi:hypothetical protein
VRKRRGIDGTAAPGVSGADGNQSRNDNDKTEIDVPEHDAGPRRQIPPKMMPEYSGARRAASIRRHQPMQAIRHAEAATNSKKPQRNG